MYELLQESSNVLLNFSVAVLVASLISLVPFVSCSSSILSHMVVLRVVALESKRNQVCLSLFLPPAIFLQTVLGV